MSKVLYDKIHQRAKPLVPKFDGKPNMSIIVGIWMTAAREIRDEFLLEGLLETAKEVQKLARQQLDLWYEEYSEKQDWVND